MADRIMDIFMLQEIGTVTTIREVIITVFVSFILSMIIAYVYIKTYRGRFYSQNFVQTLVIIGVVISIIIVAIGSNIARAFSLSGALAIVRFRSIIADPKDIAFIFFVLGAGLATGAGLLVPAIIFVILLSALILLLDAVDFGKNRGKNKLLKITIPENLNYEGLFDDVLEKYLKEYTLLRVRTVELGTMFELVYSIVHGEEVNEKDMIDEIRARNGNLRVDVIMDQQYM